MMLPKCDGESLENSLDCKDIKPINPIGNQPQIFIGKTDAEVEAPTFWPLMQRANSLDKTSILGMMEGRRRRGQQRMRWLDSITDSKDINLSKFQETEKGSLVCCSPWGQKESDTTERLN